MHGQKNIKLSICFLGLCCNMFVSGLRIHNVGYIEDDIHLRKKLTLH